MASRQITDVAAKLQPADRALLELSVTRGLDDTRIAQLTGMPSESVSSRRRQILTTLAAELGVAPSDVIAELRADETRPAPTSAADAAPPSPTPAGPVVGVTPRRRRRPWIVVALLAGAGVVVLVLLLIVGGGTHRDRLAPAPRAGAPVRPRAAVQLRPLPGGLSHASGTLTLNRSHGSLTLTLNVRSLPYLRHGHYEAWLYDSILDSRALGTVRPNGVTRLRLPADAASYRHIDVSDQPRGMVNPSGESRLRGPNPARVSRRGPNPARVSRRGPNPARVSRRVH